MASTAIQTVPQIMAQLDTPAMRTELLKALPEDRRNVDRMLRVVHSLLQSKTDLSKCTANSIVGAVVECFQLGLEPGAIGHVYFVPYKSHCQLIVGYKGIMELGRRSGNISRFYADVVREGDAFEYELGTHQHLRHKPKPGNSGKIIHAYALAKQRDGEEVFKVIGSVEIAKALESSAAGQRGPWRDHEAAMWMKTAVRRLAPLLPQCVELQTAAALEDMAEAGKEQVFSTDFSQLIDVPAEVVNQEHAEKAAALRERARKAMAKSRARPAKNEPPPPDDDMPPIEEPRETVPLADEPGPDAAAVEGPSGEASLPFVRISDIAGLTEDGTRFCTRGFLRTMFPMRGKGKGWDLYVQETAAGGAKHKMTLWGSKPDWLETETTIVISEAYLKGQYADKWNVTIESLETAG